MEERYAEERRWSKTTDWASFLAIFIAWLGLMGMMRLSIQKRTKEVGIRKVLGASTPGLIGLLSRRFFMVDRYREFGRLAGCLTTDGKMAGIVQ